jgi:hypothetical protein
LLEVKVRRRRREEEKKKVTIRPRLSQVISLGNKNIDNFESFK